MGDFGVDDVSFLPDPCPLPEALKKRALNEKERMIYAPMAGVGGVVYDKDAVYIDLPGGHARQQQVRGWHILLVLRIAHILARRCRTKTG